MDKIKEFSSKHPITKKSYNYVSEVCQSVKSSLPNIKRGKLGPRELFTLNTTTMCLWGALSLVIPHLACLIMYGTPFVDAQVTASVRSQGLCLIVLGGLSNVVRRSRSDEVNRHVMRCFFGFYLAGTFLTFLFSSYSTPFTWAVVVYSAAATYFHAVNSGIMGGVRSANPASAPVPFPDESEKDK
eukprot:173593_1